jgi:hypothetical protein
MAPREELPGHVKTYIIQRLARYDTPTQVAKGVKDDFGIEVTRQRVHYYDPTSRMGAGLPQELKALFEATREKFLKDPPKSPIASSTYRLAVLQRALELAETRGQLPEVRAALEAAAKEVGGAFTNKLKHEHTGKDGGPIESVAEIVPADLTGKTDEQLHQLYRDAAASSARVGPERGPTTH